VTARTAPFTHQNIPDQVSYFLEVHCLHEIIALGVTGLANINQNISNLKISTDRSTTTRHLARGKHSLKFKQEKLFAF
jgi:hypothetical protein